LVTQTVLPSGVIATSAATEPTGIVAITWLVAAEIAETLLLLLFATYTSDPSGVTATPSGPLPTGITGPVGSRRA
jgi:hypothetical protein